MIPEERAAYLLEELSLDEKVAQLNCVFPFDKASYDFAGINEQNKHGIGQVSTLEMRRMESLDEVVRWQRKVQRIVMENSPHRIPAIFHMEDSVEHLFRIPQAFLPELEGVPGMESKVGGENCRNCKPSGSCLWYYACLCPCA